MAESGIYEIVNRVNGKRYVGSAISIGRRWREHRRDLERGSHHSRALLRAWTKYGEESFVFSIIENCAIENLIVREQAAMDALLPEYNCCPKAGSSLGFKHSPSTRALWSEERRSRYQAMNADERKALTAHFLTPENVRKAAEGKIGKKRGPMPDAVKLKLSSSKSGVPNLKSRGRIVSQETREKLRQASLGQKHSIECRKKRSVLTDAQVEKILLDRMSGQGNATCARNSGVPEKLVGKVLRRERYDWVRPDITPESYPPPQRGGWKRSEDAVCKARATRASRKALLE